MSVKPYIFEYDSYHEWLRAWFEARHAQDTSYTAATFLQRVDDGPRTLIANVISNRKRAGSAAPERGISLERARKWLPELGLEGDAATYWLLLVDIEKVRGEVRARDRVWQATPTPAARRQLEARWAKLLELEEQRLGLRRFSESVRTVYDTALPGGMEAARTANASATVALRYASDNTYLARTRLQGLSQAIHPADIPKLLSTLREIVVRVAGRTSAELEAPPEPWGELSEPRPDFLVSLSAKVPYRLHLELFPVTHAVEARPFPPPAERTGDGWDVFRYTDYRKALTDWFASPAAKNTSQRKLAMVAEIDPAMLARVVRLEMHLTEPRAMDLASAMGLDPHETRYFALLARHGEEEHPADPELAALRAAADLRRMRRAAVKLLKDWQMIVLPELARCGISLRDYARVAECLDPNLTAAEVERSVEALVEVQLLGPDVDGDLRPIDAAFNAEVWPGAGEMERALYEGHVAMNRNAAAKVGKPGYHAVGARMTISAEQFRQLKKEMVQIARDLCSRWATFTHAPDRVIYVNYMIFPDEPTG